MKDEKPNIFCNGCGNHAQPTPQASDRKQVVIHDKNSNEDYYLQLTDDQIKLLEYLLDEYIIEGGYQVIESHTFKVI